MTTIIGKLKDGKLSIHGDKRVSGGYNIITHIKSKISNFNGVLIGLCGDYIDRDYLEDLHTIYVKENKEIETKLDAISFHKYITTISGKTDISIMVLTEEIQVIVSEGGLDLMEIKDDEGFFSMGSGFVSALTLYRYDPNIPIKTIYDIVSDMDNKTSKEFNSLTIKIGNKKTSTK